MIFFFNCMVINGLLFCACNRFLKGSPTVCRGNWDYLGTVAGSWVEMRKHCSQIKACTNAKQVSFRRTHRI